MLISLQAQQGHFRQAQHFEDPAIMSASFATMPSEPAFQSYRPPPGLPVPQRLSPSPAMFHTHQNGIINGRNDSAHGEFFISYLKGREASVPSARAFSVRNFYYRQ